MATVAHASLTTPHTRLNTRRRSCGSSCSTTDMRAPMVQAKRAHVRCAFLSGGKAKALAATRVAHPEQRRLRQRASVITQAKKKDDSATEKNSADYVRAIVENVGRTSGHAPVIFLKMIDGSDLVLPVFIGEAECSALLKEIRNQQTLRPMTHDLMKNSLELLKFRVSKVQVTDMRDNTFYARVFFQNEKGEDVDSIDARPSDAINLAVRFGSPIYVSKDVVKSSAYLMQAGQEPGAALAAGNTVAAASQEGEEDSMVSKIQQQVLRRKDPALELRSRLALAIAEEQYDEAAQIQDQIAAAIGSDKIASLLNRMEQAVADERYAEAARLRDELQALDEEEERLSNVVFGEQE
jgi:bifunctional DNase/RNase